MSQPTVTQPSAPSPRSHRVLIFNVGALIVALVLGRLEIIRLLSVPFPDLLGLWGLGTAGVAGLVVTLLPKTLRSRILVRLRRTISSPYATMLLSLALLVVLAAATLARIEIRWIGPDKLPVRIGNSHTQLHLTAREAGYNVTQRIVPSFLSFEISTGPFLYHDTPLPLSVSQISIPIYATAERDERGKDIELSLLSAYFQFFEQREIEKAERLLDAYDASSAADRDAVRRFHIIKGALSAIFVQNAPDVALSRSNHLAATSPGDPWHVFLKAGISYSAKRYSECRAILSADFIRNLELWSRRDMAVAARFFRGACELNDGSSARVEGYRAQQLAAARADFALAEAAANRLEEGDFKELALPSAIIFRGISVFYAGDFDGAVDTFSRSFSVGRTDLRARALNAAGYARFVQGNVPEASSLLVQSMSVVPNFPYARSNFGFVLMSDKSQYARSRQYFTSNVQDLTLQKISPRDVILGKISLVHLSELQNDPLPEVVEKYARLSRELGGNDWDEIDPVEIRYGYLARELTDRIYLNGKYYAVELFALTYLCRAKERVDALATRGDAAAVSLNVSLDTSIQRLRRQVNPNWLSSPGNGWFSALNGC